MLPETVVASFITACAVAFFLVNLHNLLKGRPRREGAKTVKVYAEIGLPRNLAIDLAGLGTLIFFLESILYLVLVFAGYASLFGSVPLQLRFLFDFYVQVLGLALMGMGYMLFIWSVIARGRYATSWAMPEDHKLVTWGPYRFVRHPSYLAYFLIFFGLPLAWLNLVAMLPLVAVPGYVSVSKREEELLVLRFGNEYRQYQSVTGKFFPQLRKKER